MIRVQQLTKTYSGQIHAVRDVNLEIGPGMFGLVGPNGAGKTTLMRIMAGLMRPTKGTIHVFDHDLQTHRGRQAAKRLLGYLPQELGLYPDLTALELLDYIAVLKGLNDRHARRKQIAALIDVVRLGDVAQRKIKTYSGGMKRRVGIAQALLGQPQLVIVDEPTVGLDPEERVRLRNLFAEVAANCTVLLSTHIVEDISQSCRDLVVLQGGQVVFRGSPRALIDRARGHTWLITTGGERPNGGLTVVSTLQLEAGTQYRVLGTPGSQYAASPCEPSLEDGYLWLMRPTAGQ